ncbi:MAG: helix-turn-helix domain-containing protein [Prochloraceae cyanobacterium]
MNLKQRKQKFTKLLEDLLEDRGGAKGKLAKELEISPARFTHWIQGKVDPAGLDIVSFKQIANLKGCSIDQLAQILGFVDVEEQSEAKFKKLVQELLINKTQEELADRLGVNQATISRWLSPDKKTDLKKIPAKTMFSLAREKEWTLDKLFDYLKLESNTKINNNGIVNNSSPVKIQIELCNRRICMILEKENIKIASRYSSNLVLHIKLNPSSLEFVTIPTLPETLENFDLLIFNIESKDSAIIKLINRISFNGDIVIFTLQDLEKEVRSQLQDKVTDIVVKPLDWESLKDKPYFAGI